jgi:hypothetical protein
MRTHAVPAPLRAAAPLIVAGILAIGASAASGLEPFVPADIPASAFAPVVLPSQAPAPTAFAAPTAALGPLIDPWLPSPPAERAQPVAPAPIAIVHVIPKPTPKPAPKPSSGGAGSSGGGSGSGGTSGSTSHSISGRASYYCRAGVSPCTVNHPDTSGFDAYAAAGPRLRAALGSGWRGMVVSVDGVRVKLIDWCQCYEGQSNEKLLDLYYDVFARVGSSVTIKW